MNRFLIFSFLACLVLSSSDLQAFQYRKKKQVKSQPAAAVKDEKTFGSVRVFEKPGYTVLFSVYPVPVAKGWSEIGYKLVDRAADPAKLFGTSGWAEVRFQDKDAHDLASGRLPFKDSKTEYYGFIRIENSKTASIAQVDLKPVMSSVNLSNETVR